MFTEVIKRFIDIYTGPCWLFIDVIRLFIDVNRLFRGRVVGVYPEGTSTCITKWGEISGVDTSLHSLFFMLGLCNAQVAGGG